MQQFSDYKDLQNSQDREKGKSSRLRSFPLLAAFSNPEFHLDDMEELDDDDLSATVFVATFTPGVTRPL